MNINEGIAGLSNAIKAAPEFSKLIQAKSGVQKDLTLKRELEQFEKKQKELYSGKLSAKEAESRISELKSKFESLSKIPEVDKYLKALKDFNDLTTRVYKDLNDSLQKDLK